MGGQKGRGWVGNGTGWRKGGRGWEGKKGKGHGETTPGFCLPPDKADMKSWKKTLITSQLKMLTVGCER